MAQDERLEVKSYYSNTTNPYSFKMYKSINAKGARCFYNEITEIVRQFEEIKKNSSSFFEHETDKTRFLELFLRRIPHNAFYKKSDIDEANILFISNEPGLTNAFNLYNQFLTEYVTIEKIEKSFNDAMLSWLEMSDLNNGGVNGDDFPDKSSPQYKLGKIGYFLPGDTSVKKVIHLDLFPYAQKNKDDINERNNKKEISESIRIDSLSIENANCTLERIINTNLQTIKDFINTKTKKYILIIGNRVLSFEEGSEDGAIPNANYVSGSDNRAIIYKILRYLQKIGNPNIEVRISRKWPSNLKKISIYELDRNQDKGISFIKIKS